MKLSEIIPVLEKMAPPALQEAYDNSGLQCGDRNREIRGALLSLDCTEAVVLEAIKKKCNLIVVHHPLLFKSIKSLTGKNEVERTLLMAIKKDIAIYAAHTSLDNVITGVNGKIADKLGLQKRRILLPMKGHLRKLVVFCPVDFADKVREAICKAGAGHIGNYEECTFNANGVGTFKGNESTKPFVGKKNVLHKEKEIRIETVFPDWEEKKILTALFRTHPYEEVAYDIYPLENEWKQTGSGMMGELKTGMEAKKFLTFLKEVFNVPALRHTPLRKGPIKKVALCGGAGSFLLPHAIAAGADAFVTGDFKYHEFFGADGKILAIDVGHAESEQFTPELFYEAIRKKFPKFAIHFSKANTNPVNYF